MSSQGSGRQWSHQGVLLGLSSNNSKISHLYGLRNVARVLVDGGQVGVSIGKGRVNLDGTGIALQGSLDVLHFLEGVAHVTTKRKKGKNLLTF